MAMRTQRAGGCFAAALAVLCAPSILAAETFDVSVYEKQPYEIKGYVEGRGEWLRLDPDAKGYALQFPGMTTRDANRSAAVG